MAGGWCHALLGCSWNTSGQGGRRHAVSGSGTSGSAACSLGSGMTRNRFLSRRIGRSAWSSRMQLAPTRKVIATKIQNSGTRGKHRPSPTRISQSATLRACPSAIDQREHSTSVDRDGQDTPEEDGGREAGDDPDEQPGLRDHLMRAQVLRRLVPDHEDCRHDHRRGPSRRPPDDAGLEEIELLLGRQRPGEVEDHAGAGPQVDEPVRGVGREVGHIRQERVLHGTIIRRQSSSARSRPTRRGLAWRPRRRTAAARAIRITDSSNPPRRKPPPKKRTDTRSDRHRLRPRDQRVPRSTGPRAAPSRPP
jgi:hypothetical protein